MATALKVPQASAVKLLKELNVTGAAKANEKKLVKLLTSQVEGLNGDPISELDISNKSKSLLEEVQEAIDEERKVVVVAAAAEEEEDEAPKKRTAKSAKSAKTTKTSERVKTQRKGKSAKEEVVKKTKRKGGKSDKDQVFDAWIKNPTAAPKAIADKMEDKLNAKATTIAHWVSDFKRGGESVGYPRGAKGREKEIKMALKAIKAAK